MIKMNLGKAASPSEVAIQLIKAMGEKGEVDYRKSMYS